MTWEESKINDFETIDMTMLKNFGDGYPNAIEAQTSINTDYTFDRLSNILENNLQPGKPTTKLVDKRKLRT